MIRPETVRPSPSERTSESVLPLAAPMRFQQGYKCRLAHVRCRAERDQGVRKGTECLSKREEGGGRVAGRVDGERLSKR